MLLGRSEYGRFIAAVGIIDKDMWRSITPMFLGYPYAAFACENGGLTITMPSNGSAGVFNQNAQDTLARLMRDVAADRETRVVIVEGTGETFCAGLDMDEVVPFVAQFDASSADRWIAGS
jgi:enoyl-CoA hydratase/carnithine racemase